MGYSVSVDADKCIGCAACADICPQSVYEMVDGKSNPKNDDCVGCESCTSVCPQDAITITED